MFPVFRWVISLISLVGIPMNHTKTYRRWHKYRRMNFSVSFIPNIRFHWMTTLDEMSRCSWRSLEWRKEGRLGESGGRRWSTCQISGMRKIIAWVLPDYRWIWYRYLLAHGKDDGMEERKVDHNIFSVVVAQSVKHSTRRANLCDLCVRKRKVRPSYIPGSLFLTIPFSEELTDDNY